MEPIGSRDQINGDACSWSAWILLTYLLAENCYIYMRHCMSHSMQTMRDKLIGVLA